MLNKNIVFLFLSLLFGACSSSENKPAEDGKRSNVFEQKWFSFSIPDGWSVTEKDTVSDNGYYLSCEKSGLTESAIITVTVLNDTLDLNQMMSLYQENLRSNEVYQNSDIRFSEIQESPYGQYPGLKCSYTLTLLGVNFKGYIYSFYGKGSTFNVIEQCAIKNEKELAPEFAVAASSFSVK